jgi:hypothetical protein
MSHRFGLIYGSGCFTWYGEAGERWDTSQLWFVREHRPDGRLTPSKILDMQCTDTSFAGTFVSHLEVRLPFRRHDILNKSNLTLSQAHFTHAF